MFYCPRCKAEVAPEALYCEKCGYNSTAAASQANTATSTPGQSPRLIRPIRIQSSKQADAPVTPSIPNIDFSVPPQSTPAHLLALSPMTPPSVSALSSSSPPSSPGKTQGQQFMQPGFGAPIKRGPDSLPALPQAKETQNPLFPTHPTQQRTTPATTPTWQAQSVGHHAERGVDYPKLQATQTSQMQAPFTADVTSDNSHPQLLQTLDDFEGYDEGYAATSQAAERWRTSWRQRQHTEAGPATDVSRGQSSVPEPLMRMQQSFVRLRAIIVPRQQRRAKLERRGFWIITGLLICLMVGLLSYIIWSFLPIANPEQPVNTSIPTAENTLLPSLSVRGKQITSIIQGQMLHIHGDNFNIGAPIIFLLDGLTAINGTNGRELALETSNQGSFDVDIPTRTWSPGEHSIQAQDNNSGQIAYLNIQVNLAQSTTVNAQLSLSVSTKLIFNATPGKGDPPERFVKLTNKDTRASLQWSATAEVDNDLSWLGIDPETTGGTLRMGGIGTIGISVTTAGLTSSPTPYTGKIIFTINQTEQLTLPVELEVQNTPTELVVSPNPLIGIPGADGSCQAQSLLLVNISGTQVSWNIQMDSATKQHIQFLSNGKPTSAGLLAATGEDGDTQALTLMCMHVQNRDTYSFTISGNNVTWLQRISITANP